MLRTIIRAMQVVQALPRVVNYIVAAGWSNPTDAQYRIAVLNVVEDIRTTTEERDNLVEAFMKLRDRVVQEAAKKIKP